MSLSRSDYLREVLSRPPVGRIVRPTSVPRMDLESWLCYRQDRLRAHPHSRLEDLRDWAVLHVCGVAIASLSAVLIAALGALIYVVAIRG